MFVMKNWILPFMLCIAMMMTTLMDSCYYDNEQDLYPVAQCDTSAVTYTSTVEPIVNVNCLNCHSAAENQGGITLEGYDATKAYVDAGSFMGTINHASGSNPMPKNASKLSDCDIQKLQSWVNAGAPNN